MIQKSQPPIPPPPSGHPILLPHQNKYSYHLQSHAKHLVISNKFNLSKVRRWGHIHLPNGQIACSIFSDQQRKSNTCVSHNIKVSTNIVKI